jgi:hypothetical protein
MTAHIDIDSAGRPGVEGPGVHEPIALSRITATTPLGLPPTWAILQRHLFGLLDTAWRRFERRYCYADGSLRYDGQLVGRDGVDDFYEAFFNWPNLYLLGGAADLLAACKQHWRGVTHQLTARGFLTEEFENGYDWFHQGESLLFFYGICAADPGDPEFRERAERFAGLYLSGSPSGNYDPEHAIIRAPHNGAQGPLDGLGEHFEIYSTDLWSMEPYGLPLTDVEGIESWEDLRDPANAQRMGREMRHRLAAGDTAVNLCATSLVANAWLYDNRDAYADWVLEYVDGWRRRANELGGVMPDNVGPSGMVGELHEGRWFGGHYGWAWPHGVHSVGAAALIGAMNAHLVGADGSVLELARMPLRQVAEHRRPGRVRDETSTLQGYWLARLGPDADHDTMLVPYRRSTRGWFDHHPMQLAFPMWLWWTSGAPADRHALDALREESGYDWSALRAFRDKEEAGHEAPWYAFLCGDNPAYPEEALRMAIAQATHRLALMAADETPADEIDIHWWQRMNPVVTEVLTQLTTGAPQTLYNGGLHHARVRYADADAGRPGLPSDVAALVDSIDGNSLSLTLVNLAATEQRNVIVSGGAFGENRFDVVRFSVLSGDYPGSSHSVLVDDVEEATGTVRVGDSRLLVALPPSTTIRLDCEMTLRAFTPRHQRFNGDHIVRGDTP